MVEVGGCVPGADGGAYALRCCEGTGELFQLVFEKVTVGIAMTSLEGRIRMANPAMCRILGRAAGDVVGHFADEFTHPDDVALTSALVHMATSGGLTSADKRYIHPDGTVVPVHIDSMLVQPADGAAPYFFSQVQDISERKQFEAALERQALHDALTGLPARTLLTDRLEHALGQAERRRALVALMMVDIDGLSQVNESFGYPAGDAVLVEMAGRLRGALGNRGTVGRLDGDEFLVLYWDVPDAHHARRQADDLSRLLLEPFKLCGEEHELSASIGVAVAGPGTEVDEALREVSSAMYRAKQRGPGLVEVFEPALDRPGGELLRAKAALKRALHHGELSLAYQPVVEVNTGAAVAAEALLRWHDPQRGDVPPAEFIGLAEQSGIIGELGDWVLRRVCQELPEIMATAGVRLPVSVNLSAHQLSEPGLGDRVATILAESGLDPHLLIFEVTETALCDDAVAAGRALQGLRSLGARIAVDDFGTGYSSLSSLKQFPVDILKVDRGFVDGLGRDANDTVIVDAVVNLAHTLGLTVIAEGVERPAQVAALQGVNCRYAQGFLFSRPVPAPELARALALPLSPAARPGGLRHGPPPSFEPVALPRAVLDSLPFATALVDHLGTVVATNLGWKQFAPGPDSAHPGAAGVGANYLEACDAVTSAAAGLARAAAHGLRQVLAGERDSFEIEYRYGERWLNMVVTPAPLAGGGAVIMRLDTTARREAEEALRVSEVQARATFESAPIGIARLDASGRVLEANQALAGILGRQREEIQGAALSLAWPADGAAATWSQLHELLLAGGTAQLTEQRFTRPDGTVRYANVAACLVRFDDDRPPLVIATVEDVTERRELTEQLRRSQELEAIGRLAGGIAHEINTPAQFIGSNLSYLREAFEDLSRALGLRASPAGAGGSAPGATSQPLDELTTEIPLAISEASEGVDRVTSIVKALKAFGHPDQGAPVPSDINEALRNTLVVARNEYKYVADLVTDFAELPLVTCYPGDLKQAFLNLVVNAADAIRDVVGTSGARGVITVSTGHQGDKVVVRVADTGCGIEDKVAARIFEPFFTTKEVGRGTGQGLSVVRAAVVERHRGEISFTSQPGEGTCFTLRLPVAPPSPAGERGPAPGAGTTPAVS